ncbi:hypothetical protein Ciccas_007375 [Cichlidogyrus casuarinus]|uniref:HEPN domain-containing protein n=1 Tax=Cichlidogyrus casuarinus TaxID=1844966 RepID=A0ABD2Q3T3_9PLAT
MNMITSEEKLRIALEADDEEAIGRVLFSDYRVDSIHYNCMAVQMIECSTQICHMALQQFPPPRR